MTIRNAKGAKYKFEKIKPVSQMEIDRLFPTDEDKFQLRLRAAWGDLLKPLIPESGIVQMLNQAREERLLRTQAKFVTTPTLL